MSASLAISSAALAQSSAALSRARAAECKAFMPSYDPATATPEVMQAYASCIELLHPVASSASEILFLKTMIVVALIGMVVGAWRMASDAYDLTDGLIMGVCGAVMGACVGPLVMIAVAAIYLGIGWVIS